MYMLYIVLPSLKVVSIKPYFMEVLFELCFSSLCICYSLVLLKKIFCILITYIIVCFTKLNFLFLYYKFSILTIFLYYYYCAKEYVLLSVYLNYTDL